MPLIHANNTQLWVERFGDPSLPPVLLLHGLFFSGAMYAAQLPLLTPQFLNSRSSASRARATCSVTTRFCAHSSSRARRARSMSSIC